ncbi:hypothetical protein ACFZBP_20965 [Streptomyces sp. NPDC008086]|uniref:hypothetical protein n=1 Tax=Streptomyces sp. NPDC008086 TaxID=3364807 RepID=UPI0036E79392
MPHPAAGHTSQRTNDQAIARRGHHRQRQRSTVNLGPFHDAHGHNCTVYWNADGGRAPQWSGNGTADNRWRIVRN